MSEIKEQRCLRSIKLSSEDISINLKLKGAIVNVVYDPHSGIIELILWDNDVSLAEAMPLKSTQVSTCTLLGEEVYKLLYKHD